MKKTPRKHQQDAYEALMAALKDSKDAVPYAKMHTGSGKSLVCAMFADTALKAGRRALILVPYSELCEQNFKETVAFVDKKHWADVGIVSAKLGRKQLNKKIVIATYTSFLNNRTKAGSFDLVVIDECHYVSNKPMSSYRKILRSLWRINPNVRIIGMTATPYRAEGVIHEDNIEGKRLFTECVFSEETHETATLQYLMEQGYISHITSISGDVQVDMDGVPLAGKDYNTNIMGARFDDIVVDAVKDIKAKVSAYNIKTGLIFASNIANAERIVEEWGDDSTIRLIHGKLPNKDRKEVIDWLKNETGKLRLVVNVQILTTGFDYQRLDYVCMMRATTSVSLYIQCVGRVLRAHDSKEMAYFHDFGGNIERHGPIDAIIPPKTKTRRAEAPKKICGLCETPNRLSAKKCSNCDAIFVTENKDGKYQMRTQEQILQQKIEDSLVTMNVGGVLFEKTWSKTGYEMIKMGIYDDSGRLIINHYLCLDHPGSAKGMAKQFILNMLKNREDFYALGTEGVTTDNMYKLLGNPSIRDKYFKKIVSVKVGKQKKNMKYNELKRVVFEG